MVDDTPHTYYCCWYRLDDTDGYLIWFSNDTDGVVTQDDGFVPGFCNLTQLHAYAASLHIDIKKEEPKLHDIDSVKAWLNATTLSRDIDCDNFLSVWNLFADISDSVCCTFDQDKDRTQDIYNKLFWGNNLPAITPPGKHYSPTWNEDELLLIKEVLTNGLLLFQSVVRPV